MMVPKRPSHAVNGLRARTVVAAAAALLLLSACAGGNGDVEAQAELDAVLAQSSDDAEDAEVELHDAGELALPVETQDVFINRDPFDPVVPEPEPTTSEDGDEGGSGGDGANGEDGSVVNGDGVRLIPPPTDEASCQGTDEIVCGGRVVALRDVTATNDGGQTAAIQVDEVTYHVVVGDIFAQWFELHGIDGSCVSILFGDEHVALCKADTAMK